MVVDAASSRQLVGSVVGGKYHVERMLGAGGMGAVFAARNTLTDKLVALKWMHPEIAADPHARERFLREARASARVRHPNVVDVYDVVSEDGALFLVMELLEGETLTELMHREQTPLTEVFSHLVAAMRGVAAAHRKQIIHRDIKPDNIFLAREGDDPRPVPKVLDFGISKLISTGDVALTRTGAALGTPLYMSVEQLTGAKDIDGRADVYAFGVILYEAVTGRPPFEADTYAALIAKMMTQEALEAEEVRPEVPAQLAALISRAMAKDRSKRTADLDTLMRELEPFATGAGFASKRAGGSGGKIPLVWTRGSRPDGVSEVVVQAPSGTFERGVGARRESLGDARSSSAKRGAWIAFAAIALAALGWLAWRGLSPRAAEDPNRRPIEPTAPVPIVAGASAQPSAVAPEPAPAQPAPAARNQETALEPAAEQALPAARPQPEPAAPHRATRRSGSSGTRREPPPSPAQIGTSPALPAAPGAPAPAEPAAAPAARDTSFRAGKPTRKDF